MNNKKNCESTICFEGCKLESLASIDERGQIVLPKDLREKAKIKTGDKMAIVLCQNKDGNICCISLIKAEALTESIKKVLRPLLTGLMK